MELQARRLRLHRNSIVSEAASSEILQCVACMCDNYYYCCFGVCTVLYLYTGSIHVLYVLFYLNNDYIIITIVSFFLH